MFRECDGISDSILPSQKVKLWARIVVDKVTNEFQPEALSRFRVSNSGRSLPIIFTIHVKYVASPSGGAFTCTNCFNTLTVVVKFYRSKTIIEHLEVLGFHNPLIGKG